MKIKGLWSVSLTVLTFVSSVPGALAQDVGVAAAASDNGGQLDEIIVTARKREESLISVPVAVTALGANDLERYKAASLDQIAQMAPQLIIANSPTGSGASLTIRGIGSVAEDPGVDQSVAVYMDNVGLSRGRIIGLSMFDLAQVEILKGPQALFFGKNSPAGVVSLTSAGPGNHFEGKISAGYEFNADEAYLEAAVGGPVSSTLGVRVAVRAEQMQGWMKNVAQPIFDPLTGLMAPGATDDRDPKGKKIAGRLTLEFKPDDQFSLVGKVFAAHARNNGSAGSIEHMCLPGVSFSVAGVPDPAEDCTVNRVRVATAVNPVLTANWPKTNGGRFYSDTDLVSASVTAGLDLKTVSLTWVTSGTLLDYSDFFSACQCSYQALIPQSNERTKLFTQEFRVNTDFSGPLNFTAGAYYEYVDRKAPNSAALLFLGADPRGTGRMWNITREAFNKGETLSAFGQARWKIFDELELAGGVRFSHDRKSIRTGNSFVNPLVPLVFGPDFVLPEETYLSGHFRNSNWSPEATLTWRPDTSKTIYVAYKTGYKSGGFSNPLLLASNATLANLTYDPETTKGWEAGFKGELFDRKLRVELAAYRYRYYDLQQSAFESATLSYFIRNAAAARTQGVELSTEWQATRSLRLRGDIAYNEARFSRFPGSPCYQGQTWAQGCTNPLVPPPADLNTTGGVQQDLAGKQLPRAPDVVGTAGFTWETPLTSNLIAAVDGDARYSSSYYTDSALTPYVRQNGFWLFNAGIRIRPEDKRWELAFIGRNLTDRKYITYANDSALAPVGVWGVQVERGRQLTLQASLQF